MAIAALTAAIVASLAGKLNSISTIFTLDIYTKYFAKKTYETENAANEKKMVWTGKLVALFAILLAVVFEWKDLLGIDKLTMVRLSQKAENNFVGLQCGIMDMFASMMGKANHVIRLDCRSLAYEYFPLQLNDYKIVLLDTQVKHSLASSEYNTRRKECNEGVALIQEKYPAVKSLRDATIEMVNECIEAGDVKDRCTFIVEDIQ